MDLPKTKRYPSYKDTGVDWLGEIPEHWKFARMKRLFSDYSEKNKPDEELLSVTQTQGVVPRSLVENRMVMPNGNLETFKYIQKGDFAISLRSFEGGLEYSNYNGIISPAYTVLRLKIQVKHAFFKYLFKSNSFIQELQTSVVGIREGKNISYPELSYSFLPIPSLSEQKQIADFLDKKTGQIDIAINQKEQMIELLKERKQILINRAVTRGLNPDVPLKYSGIEWIGQIPEHWEIRRLKYLGQIMNGATPSSTVPAFWDGNITWVTPIDINDLKYINRSDRMITQQGYMSCGTSLVPKGSVILTTRAPIGKPTIANIPLCTNQGCKSIIINKHLISEFLYYIFTILNKYLNSLGTGTTFMELSNKELKNIILPSPSISEQQEIVSYIEQNTEKIDRAIAQKQQEIEKLKEYKATLIDSAVTGKICLSD